MASSVYREKGCKFCPKHPTKELILTCESCDHEPVCLSCISNEHKGHNVIDLDIKVKERYSYIQDFNHEIKIATIPYIKSRSLAAADTVRGAEKSILENINSVEKHHAYLKELLNQQADTAVSVMKASIESNNLCLEQFNLESDKCIETLENVVTANKETSKSKNNMLIHDEALELEDFQINIPGFDGVSTVNMKLGTVHENHIRAVFGMISCNENKEALAAMVHTPLNDNHLILSSSEFSIEKQNTTTKPQSKQAPPIPHKKQGLLQRSNPTYFLTVPKQLRNSSFKLEFDPTLILSFNDGTICVNDPSQSLVLKCIDNNSDMYDIKLHDELAIPPVFADTISDSEDEGEDELAIPPVFSDTISDSEDEGEDEDEDEDENGDSEEENDVTVHSMLVSPYDDKLYYILSGTSSNFPKSIWTFDKTTGIRVKLFNLDNTGYKFAVTKENNVMFAETDIKDDSLYITLSIYSLFGELLKTKKMAIIHKETLSEENESENERDDVEYSENEDDIEEEEEEEKMDDDKTAVSSVSVCQSTGMIAVGWYIVFKNSPYDSGEKCDNGITVLDRNLHKKYRFQEKNPDSCDDRLTAEFDIRGHLTFMVQKPSISQIVVLNVSTGQTLKLMQFPRKQLCWSLNSDGLILSYGKRADDPYCEESINIFQYIY